MRSTVILLAGALAPISASPLSTTEISLVEVIPRVRDSEIGKELSLLENSPPVVATNIALRGPTAIEEYMDKRTVALILLGLFAFQALPSGVSLAIGAYGLARNIYSLYKDCHQPQGQVIDCLFSSIDLVLTLFLGGYKLYSGINNRDLALTPNGLPIYTFYKHSVIEDFVFYSHIPTINGSVSEAALRNGSTLDWQHQVTAFYKGEETHRVYYRQAHTDDLGKENDGSYHHYRVRPSPSMLERIRKLRQAAGLKEREEADSYGLVSDYLWRHNNPTVWQTFHDNINPDTMGSTLANWMENNNAEVSCAVPVETVAGVGGSSQVLGNRGIVAYGWNDQAYGFNGRAGGWVDGCSNA
ncbi:hypothetical protein M422DRAFT_46830 [Sphaerobolus stellatus SS14]|uniref:Uncharacterized protein n=1 Tax=Sphaerobolus stellatus (strain SS14) TaxID=990650 RepID=A0A0C9W2Y6_SPHS4|nr:hypothetical protein M422DRAFT_46830 [Sphaerobolus stellatus SS14]